MTVIEVNPPAEGENDYDVLLCALGYESRSVHAAQITATRAATRIASAFPTDHVLAFDRNRRWFERHGFAVSVDSVETLRARLRGAVSAVDSDTVRIAIDISCLSRNRIAAVVCELADQAQRGKSIDAEFIYVVARYTAPRSVEPPITIREPASPELAGWGADPSIPTAIVIGLGYERDKAAGVLEYFDPGGVWAFVPAGIDVAFARKVRAANESFLAVWPKPVISDYRIIDPVDCFVRVESLITGLLPDFRPVIVPLGPKIFALCAMLAARVHMPAVGVWRISSGDLERPIDRRAEGTVVRFGVAFRRD